MKDSKPTSSSVDAASTLVEHKVNKTDPTVSAETASPAGSTTAVGHPNCPVCGVPNPAYVMGRVEMGFEPGENRDVQYYACGMCGTVFKDHRHTMKSVKGYYENQWQFETQRPDLSFQISAQWIIQHTSPYRFNRDKKSFRSALDVGAKSSKLLQAVMSEGVEIDELTSLDPQPKDDGTTYGWLGEGDIPPVSAELVCATHVLEHTTAIHAFVRDLVSLVDPGGFLYVEVPSLELGSFSAGISDDINRAHMFHFTVPALVELFSKKGLFVAATQTDELVEGWAVNRILLRRGMMTEIGIRMLTLLNLEQESRYSKAVSKLNDEDPETTCLYGASNTYHTLMQRWPDLVSKFKVFDLFRSGQEIYGNWIEHPDRIQHQKVVIVPRFWASVQDIKKYLAEKHPAREVEALFDESA